MAFLWIRNRAGAEMTRQGGAPSGLHRATGAPSPTIPSSQGIPKRSVVDPYTLTVKFDEPEWNVLRQFVRSGQCESLEDAVKFCVAEIGARAGGE